MSLWSWIEIIIALLPIPAAYLGCKKALKSMHDNSRVSKMDARVTHTEQAIQAILHDSLYKRCTFFISKGSISLTELDNIEHLYKGYASVGGDGTGKTLYNKVLALKILDDDKE